MKTVDNINVKGNVFQNKKLIFYIAMMAIPVIQFCIMYIGVNFNSILLAFQKYNIDTGRYVYNGFQNFILAWMITTTDPE